MSQFAHEYPEDYEQRLEAMVDAADNLRKERKENPCPECSGTGKLLKGGAEEGNCYACKGWGVA